MELHFLFFFFFFFFFISKAGGFEVELIHRDSPLSPLYNPTATPRDRVRGASLRSLARLRKYQNLIVQSNITTATGEFLMTFSIGTPSIQTFAVMDTGSDLTWIQCPPCINCFSQNTSLFNPTKSSSYRKLECGSPFCHPVRAGNCTAALEECPYSYEYGDGSTTHGVLAIEKFVFKKGRSGGTITAPHVVFGCGNNNLGSFSGSGIVGLGEGSLSLISQLGTKLEKTFSYCLPKAAEISGTFKFGARASFSGKKVVSTPLIKDESHPSFYYVNLAGISVGTKRLSTKKVASGKGNTIIDSGTTFNVIERELYSIIVAITKELIGLPTVRQLMLPYDLCYATPSLRNISVPTFTYHFSGGDIRLNNLNILISHEETTCIAIAPSDNGFNIYGNVAQKNFEVEYNLERKIVSFADSECSWKGAGGRVQSYPFVISTFCILLFFLYFV